MPTAITRPIWFTWLLVLLLGVQLTLLVEALRATESATRSLALNAVAGAAIIGGLLAGVTRRRLGWTLLSIAVLGLIASLVRSAT